MLADGCSAPVNSGAGVRRIERLCGLPNGPHAFETSQMHSGTERFPKAAFCCRLPTTSLQPEAEARVNMGGVVYVDASTSGAHNGSRWCDAYRHDQDVLVAAAAYSAGIKEIRVAQGTNWPDRGASHTLAVQTATFQLIDGVVHRGGYAGCRAPDPAGAELERADTVRSQLVGLPDATHHRPVDAQVLRERPRTPVCGVFLRAERRAKRKDVCASMRLYARQATFSAGS